MASAELPRSIPGQSLSELSTESESHTCFAVFRDAFESGQPNGVQVRPLDERIRQLCAEAVSAEDSEVPEILGELQSLLREHSEFVRKMVSQTLNPRPKKRFSGSKSAA